jgi:nucleobase:cation symporter-1, NCS1 family
LRLYLPFTVALSAVFFVLSGYVLAGHASWSYRPPAPLHGLPLWATITVALVLVASSPLSYSNSADFARYLPRATPGVSVAWWTAFGGFLPSVVFTAIGALAATTLNMSDPQTALGSIMPGWFRPLFFAAVILAAVCDNAMTAYSSGLALQAVGVRIRRSRSVVLDGTIGVALTLYALLISNFLTAVTNMLALMVVLLGPSMAIYVTDLVMRRNRYRGRDLCDQRQGAPFWYSGGFNWAGIVALVLGTAAAALCVNTTLLTGPVSQAIGGIDVSLPAGMLTSAVIYAAAMRSRIGTASGGRARR